MNVPWPCWEEGRRRLLDIQRRRIAWWTGSVHVMYCMHVLVKCIRCMLIISEVYIAWNAWILHCLLKKGFGRKKQSASADYSEYDHNIPRLSIWKSQHGSKCIRWFLHFAEADCKWTQLWRTATKGIKSSMYSLSIGFSLSYRNLLMLLCSGDCPL